jgi:hypothetical protein
LYFNASRHSSIHILAVVNPETLGLRSMTTDSVVALDKVLRRYIVDTNNSGPDIDDLSIWAGVKMIFTTIRRRALYDLHAATLNLYIIDSALGTSQYSIKDASNLLRRA